MIFIGTFVAKGVEDDPFNGFFSVFLSIKRRERNMVRDARDG